MTKPSIPQGTRDFGPDQLAKRQFIFDTIRQTFVRFGFRPIETPTMENLSTLTGKYGEEGDRLLFKILNNGDYLSKANTDALAAKDSNKLIYSICDRGLRYDLTVPFARYVVMHQNEISFPFKRYQIQPVWRADKPQKGRYREFFQCDADVVGSDSLLYEAELIQIYDQVFKTLNIPVVILVNNRKILYGMAESAGCLDHFVEMTVAIDKLDKIGIDGVVKEMKDRGIAESGIEKIVQMLGFSQVSDFNETFSNSETGLKGLEEMNQVTGYLKGLKSSLTNELRFDSKLARGLNYYTGTILEVQAKNAEMGSIGGGGRYDNLTEVFGLKGVSGVGISFGAERIYDIMETLDLFPKERKDDIQVLFTSFDEESLIYGFQCLDQVRKAGINADIYPKSGKIKKQLDYANARQVPWVVVIGETERISGNLALKNMESGEQQQVPLDDVIRIIKG